MAQPALAAAMTMTVEEFLAYSVPDAKVELVRGELRVSPAPGAPHGAAAANLAFLLTLHVREQALGRVFGDSVAYVLIHLPRTVRIPDASFVRADRLPPDGIGPGPLKLAPDLAIEVLSPSEIASELEEKLHDYLVSGTSLIWVVDPVRRTVMTIPADAPVSWLAEGDTLKGGAIVSGFSCSITEIFDGIAR
jgi:Uma2 family endonuclease